MTTVEPLIERSQRWSSEMAALHPILIAAGLDAAVKWNKPCYSHDGANIAIMQEMKDFLALMFFKGALLDDPAGVLEPQGPNSHSAMRMTFVTPDQVTERAGIITDYVNRAIEVEAAGLEPERPELILVDELADRLNADPELKAAFETLTPGRQREYNLHIGDAKKTETRRARIDRYADKIRAGRGMRDRG